MKYNFRKGLESPCKIRGFLSTDYWILVAALSGAIILFILGIRSGIMAGDWNICIMTLICSIIVFPVLVKKFRKTQETRSSMKLRKNIQLVIFN